MDEQTQELIAQVQLLLERFQQTQRWYEDLLARTRTVGAEIERRVAHALDEVENGRHNPDRHA